MTASEYSGGQLQEQETNSYDVFGNMVEQDETSGGNTAVTKFANQVKNTGGVSQVWADLNATNQIQTRRLYLDAADSVFARIGSNGTEGWYLTDHLGSIGAIMNNSGTVIDHITYDPWGNPTDSNPSAGDRYKFTGQEYDSVTSQYNYRARCYDAAIGRFTSQDPSGFNAGDENLYRYCTNAPTDHVDPTGLWEVQIRKEYLFNNHFGSAESAALCWAEWENADSILSKRECACAIFIYPGKENDFHCGVLAKGAHDHILPHVPTRKDAIVVAYIHSHGNPDPNYDGENFSPADIAWCLSTNKPLYLVTPGNNLKVLVPYRDRNGKHVVPNSLGHITPHAPFGRRTNGWW